jgi:hypothetical protein
MMNTQEDLLEWLRRLDSYTNAEFGRARTSCAGDDVCVACGKSDRSTTALGLCPQCLAQRAPDYSEVVLFRPMRRRQPKGEQRTT